MDNGTTIDSCALAVARRDYSVALGRQKAYQWWNMSGMQAPSLTDAQANTILGALIANLTIVRASPERTSPGIPTTASLVPLTPVIDVFDLAEGVINVAGTVKEVIFANANALTVPDS